jgi:hypothetical protein
MMKFFRSLFSRKRPVDCGLTDHGAVSKETKGVFPYGNLYDGGAGYYWP